MADADPTPDAAEDTTPETTDDAAPSSAEPEIDWKAMARKHEREAKKARKEADEARADLDKRDEENKSAQEKALDKAREDARNEAATETSQKYRAKIRNAEIRAQAAGMFADPTDAVALVDLDDEEIFDSEGEINTDAVKAALDALIEKKPHLAAGQEPRITGSADAGKGTGADKDLESMSPADHFAAINKSSR